MNLKPLAAALLAATSLSAMADLTPTGTPCSNSDVQIGSVSATGCLGYFLGNTNNDPGFADAAPLITATWGGQGVSLTGSILNQINTGTSASFGQLAGDVVVGVHWGGGAGGGSTGYYFFNNLAATSAVVNPKDFFSGEQYGLSNVALLSVGALPPVPEPSAYAMALVGLGVLGVVARRRRQS